jgi:hypothetical protein
MTDLTPSADLACIDVSPVCSRANIDENFAEAESDRSVFEELALLFIEIAHSAEAGAAALREL